MMAATLTAAMTLGELLGSAAGLHADIEISDLVLDSRQVVAGAAFVAVPGGSEHGLRYASDALARGASAVLYEPSQAYAGIPEPSIEVPDLSARLGDLGRAFYGRGGVHSELIGVTGTNGKTTVAYLLANAMSRCVSDCAYIGTLGYGVPPELQAHELTTPDCLTLHREIASLGTDKGALEVSSHALSQNRIAGLDIRSGVFTNLSRDHLDAHGSMENYAASKARLFTLPTIHHAVLNLDDPFSERLRAELSPGVTTLGVTLDQARQADLVARFESRGMAGLRLDISGRCGQTQITSPLIGTFNAENLCLALGALLAWDVPLADAGAALATCSAPPGRMEVLGGQADPTVVIDYAHTPDALERVLATLSSLASGELWCVFGCGGERDRGKRALMGAVAANSAQHIVLTDDNPRGEDPASIVADIRAGIDTDIRIEVEHSREAAIANTLARASSGDVVLIAGKGHELQQSIAGERRPFSDRTVVEQALGGRS